MHARRLRRGIGIAVWGALGVLGMLPAPARADPSSPQLVLPLLAAIAVTRSAVTLRADATTARGLRAMLPRSLRIPDAYEIDCDRDPARWAAPVDLDKLVGFNLLPRPVYGSMVSLSYDSESVPIRRGSKLFRVVIEMPF